MTDKEEFLALFKKWGINPSQWEEQEGWENWYYIREGEDGVNGYPYFVVSFEFTPEGKFVQMGIWE